MTQTNDNKWVKEFYDKFTDGADEDNGYYDAQFTEGRPQRVEAFISKVESEAYKRAIKVVEELQEIAYSETNYFSLGEAISEIEKLTK